MFTSLLIGAIPRMGKTFAARRLASLDQHQNRRRTSWHRWTTLAILARAFRAAATAHRDRP